MPPGGEAGRWGGGAGRGQRDRLCFWGRRAGLAELRPGSGQEGARREAARQAQARNGAKLCLRRHPECQPKASIQDLTHAPTSHPQVRFLLSPKSHGLFRTTESFTAAHKET